MRSLAEAAPAPEASRAPGASRARMWPEAAAWLATAALAAIDSVDSLGRGLRALVDWRASNIGDPWPSAVAATRLASHAPLYADFDPIGSSFIYPPLAALPYAPLAGESYEAVHHALSVMSRGAWLACVVMAALLVWDRRRPLASAAFVAAGAFGFYPLLRAVELNQSTLFVTVLVGGALLLASRGRDAAAGAVLACAAAFKPQLALIVPLLAWGSPRFALGGGASLAMVGLASLGYGGLDNHVRYVTHVLPAVSVGYAFYPNQSWSGLFARLSGASPFSFALPKVSPAVRAASLVASIATLAAGAWALRRAGRAGDATSDAPSESPWRASLPLRIALAWLVVTLASPVSWEHHFAPALFVYALLFKASDALPPRARLLACLSLPFIAGTIDVRGFTGVLGTLAMSYGMAAAWLLAVALVITLAPSRRSLGAARAIA